MSEEHIETNTSLKRPGRIDKTIEYFKELSFRQRFNLLGAVIVLSCVITTCALSMPDIEDSFAYSACIAELEDLEPRHLFSGELQKGYEEAFVAVHPGFGSTRAGHGRISNRAEYSEYLESLTTQIKEAQDEGKLVIILVGANEIRDGDLLKEIDYSGDNTLTVATRSNSPFPIPCVETEDSRVVFQEIGEPGALKSFFEKLQVKKVTIGGEYRQMCVQVAHEMLNTRKMNVTVSEFTYPPQSSTP